MTECGCGMRPPTSALTAVGERRSGKGPQHASGDVMLAPASHPSHLSEQLQLPTRQQRHPLRLQQCRQAVPQLNSRRRPPAGTGWCTTRAPSTAPAGRARWRSATTPPHCSTPRALWCRQAVLVLLMCDPFLREGVLAVVLPAGHSEHPSHPSIWPSLTALQSLS